MNYLKSHRGNLAGIFIVFLLFIGSLYTRQDELNLPISPNGDWITSHTLITCEIWDESGGPQAYHFNPIYTYPGDGSEAIAAFGGVMDDKRDQYYVSYPPFSFIYAYYTTKILGGPDIYSLRSSALILHFFCSLLLYLIIRKLGKIGSNKFSIAAVFGAFLYLYSSGMLWMNGFIYFADTLVQLFLLLSIYLFIKLIQKDYKRELGILSLIALITMLGCYTEWLAVFWAFFSGLALLILYLRSKRKVLLKAFFVIGFSATITLVGSVIQFTNISGFENLKRISLEKYEERSGFASDNPDVIQFTVEEPISWELMIGYFMRNFSSVVELLIILAVLLVPVILWNRKKRIQLSTLGLIILLIGFSIGLHYLLFFNFNAIHSFSNLKTGFFLIFLIASLVLVVEQKARVVGKLTLLSLLLILGVVKGSSDVTRFKEIYGPHLFDQNRIRTAELIREYRDPDKYVFINVPSSAEMHYMSKHIVFPVSDSTHILNMMDFFKTSKAQYYHHEGDSAVYMVNLSKINDSLIVEDCIRFVK